MWPFESGCFSLQNAFMVHPCCNMDQYCIPFYSWMLVYRTDIPHFVYSFVRLTFEFFPPFVFRNMLLWTSTYKLLCRHKFLFLLGIYLVVELLGHRVTLCLTLAGTVKLFCKMAAHFVQWLRLYFLSKGIQSHFRCKMFKVDLCCCPNRSHCGQSARWHLRFLRKKLEYTKGEISVQLHNVDFIFNFWEKQ